MDTGLGIRRLSFQFGLHTNSLFGVEVWQTHCRFTDSVLDHRVDPAVLRREMTLKSFPGTDGATGAVVPFWFYGIILFFDQIPCISEQFRTIEGSGKGKGRKKGKALIFLVKIFKNDTQLGPNLSLKGTEFPEVGSCLW